MPSPRDNFSIFQQSDLAMQPLVRHAIYTMCLLAALPGCGSKPAPVKVPNAPMPAPVQAPAAGAAAPAAPQAKKAAPPAARKKAAPANPFASENPADVFVAAHTAEPMVALGVPKARPQDQFLVESGVPGSNSTQLAVAAAVPVNAHPPRDDFKLPGGFTALPAYGNSETGLPLRIRCDKDGSIMALVGGGPAIIGTDSGPSESMPQWTVFLDAYYLDVTEVTVGEYKRFQEEQREQKKRTPAHPLNESAGGNFPALGISWGDAHAYVNWLGKELPTEVEFEKAARGPDGFRAPWGNGRELWSEPRTPGTISPVGQFRNDQSIYGIFDLAGNAREWTSDWYDPKAFEEAARQSAQKPLRNWSGPKKAATGTQRVIKGSTSDWAAWNRAGSDMGARLPDVGFRGVLRTPIGGTGTEKPETPAAPTPKAATKKAGAF